MKRSNLSLKWLEVFQLAARSGSVRTVADETGLSVSTVSHHLKSLEQTLGVTLLNHDRRPMGLTPAGAVFLRYVDDALKILRRAEAEAVSGNLTQTRTLKLGFVEDFEAEIVPELAVHLARVMPHCDLVSHTRPSHEILELLRSGDIDIGVATAPVADMPDLIEYPLLRDPFVLAVPGDRSEAAEDFLASRIPLPFLRYSRKQLIGARIESQLRRLRLSLSSRFEFESNQSLLGMVAAGGGWTITTPLNVIRARRFQAQVRLLPFPAGRFSRQLSVFTAQDTPPNIADLLSRIVRPLILSHAIDPAVDLMPWIGEGFRLLPTESTGARPETVP